MEWELDVNVRLFSNRDLFGELYTLCVCMCGSVYLFMLIISLHFAILINQLL